MKKIFLFLAVAVSMSFIGCSSKNQTVVKEDKEKKYYRCFVSYKNEKIDPRAKDFFQKTDRIAVIQTNHDFSKSRDAILNIEGKWIWYQKCREFDVKYKKWKST